METQPTQQGLMQLFMGLGLSTANPLATLGASDKPSEAGFDSLLAGYLPDSTLTDSELLSATTAPIADSLLSPEASFEVITGVENLPLDASLLGDQLPLSMAVAAGKMLGQDPALAQAVNDDAAKQTSEDDQALALLENQGFYAQSLVSSALQAGNAAKSSASLAPQASMAAISEQDSAAHALASLQAKSALANKELTDASSALSAADVSDLAEDDSTLDRFLGAQSKGLDSASTSSNTTLSPLASALSSSASTVAPPPLMASAESNVSLALAMNEDPVQQSLQDLTAAEQGEKTEVEAKLLSSERKQDDQTLKLTKGQQAWGDALSERISMNAAKDIKQVTIHLDPPELGSLELKMQIKDDQQTQVQVHVQNPQVKEALESSAHRLREMLANEGLELAGFDVQTGSEQSAGGQPGGDQELAGDQQNSDTSFVEGEETVNIPIPKNNNLLDTFV